jgi:hypothetical protein
MALTKIHLVVLTYVFSISLIAASSNSVEAADLQRGHAVSPFDPNVCPGKCNTPTLIDQDNQCSPNYWGYLYCTYQNVCDNNTREACGPQYTEQCGQCSGFFNAAPSRP